MTRRTARSTAALLWLPVATAWARTPTASRAPAGKHRLTTAPRGRAAPPGPPFSRCGATPDAPFGRHPRSRRPPHEPTIWGVKPSSPLHARPLLSRLDRLRGDEGGFTLVEVMAAITVLAVGIFAAAQALTFGLSTTGLSRQRLAARSGLDQQMEEARALNYTNLVLSDP